MGPDICDVPCGTEMTVVMTVLPAGEEKLRAFVSVGANGAGHSSVPKTKLFHLKVEACSAQSTTL